MKRRSRARRILITMLALVLLVVVFLPVDGRVPQHCTYDGDVGSCETLGYRSLVTIAIANVRWGGDTTSSGHLGD